MPDCGYCDESFADQEAYDAHLRSEHADELGPIDQRRVATDDGDGLPTGPIALGIVLLAATAIVVYVIFIAGSGGGASDAEGPYDLGEVHYHGTMEVIIDGERIDFSQSKYQLQSDPFHFEGGNGQRWHVHARNVTLAWAMDSLGIQITEETVSIEGTTYDDSDPDTSVSITVNDESVRPAAYVLQPGDSVQIVVEVN